jgi:predicted nucleotidyltransferase component of viral defense system
MGFKGKKPPVMIFHEEAMTVHCQQALRLLADQSLLLSNYYLAGGTALALQIGHRVSTDLDWFSPSDSLGLQERETLRSALSHTRAFEVVREQDGQLYAKLAGADVSFLHQPHPLVEPVVRYREISLASPVDIGLMKLAAINARGARRDFLDLYCVRSLAPIERLVELAEIKYADRLSFLDVAARALAYFADAEQQPMPRLLWNEVKWENVVEYCENSAIWLTERMREKHR